MEDEALLTFNYRQLAMGNYIIRAGNPGGLTAEAQTFSIAFKKLMDINVSAGYKPMVSLYGYINELSEAPFFPFGAYSRLSIIPFKRHWGYMGFELESSWNYFPVEQENYKLQVHMPGVMIHGVYQYWLTNRVMAFDFRMGGGIYSVIDYHLIPKRRKINLVKIFIPAFAITAGVSFRWFIKKPFFVETGLDFTRFFTIENPAAGYLRPFAGAGWQF
jgi:hypothetical protein